MLKCVLLPPWRGELGVDPGGRPPRSTAPTLMATSFCRLPRPTVLFLYASRRTTDIVMDYGDTLSHTVPIHEGFALRHAILRLGGRDLTEYLTKLTTEQDQEKTYVLPDENIVTVAPNVSVSRKCCSSQTVHIYEGCTLRHAIRRLAGRDLSEYAMMSLLERGYSFTASAEREIARDVKENPSYIGLDYDTELKSIAKFDKKKTHVLPDRNIISVGAGRFIAL